MAAGLTANLTVDQLNSAIGERLLRVETTLHDLAEIRAWVSGMTAAQLVEWSGNAYTLDDANNIIGALAHAATAKAAWDEVNHLFVDRLTAPGVRV